MADPFPSLEEELDLASVLRWVKAVCPILSSFGSSNIGFLLLFLASSRHFVHGCEGIWLCLGEWILILSSLVYVGFFVLFLM